MEQKSYRIIFHIDLNCFYASCHILENPSLKNRPLVVCHEDPLKRGIVLTASYEARRYGVHAPMILRDALLKCPGLTVVNPDFRIYEKYSKRFFDYLYSITNKVEPMSVDEGFIDMSDVCDSNAYEYAKKMQDYILNVLGLPCSIGIGPNKFLAKMASDFKKPLGITILRKRDCKSMIWPLPISDLLGVGKKNQEKMDELGIKTIGDLATFSDHALLEKTFGKAMCEYFIDKCQGIDDAQVVYENDEASTSVSNETTFDVHCNNIRVLKETLHILSNQVSSRLIDKGLGAKTIGIKIKYDYAQSFSRSRSVNKPINDSMDLWGIVEEVFDDFYDMQTEVRLIGVFCLRLVDMKETKIQYSIFDNFEELENKAKVDKLLNNINNIFGEDSIRIGIDKNGK